MDTTPNPRPVVDVRYILWFAFFTSLVIYNIIAYISVEMTQGLSLQQSIALSLEDPFAMISTGVIVLAFIASIILARKPLTNTPTDFPLFIIRMAVAELPAILGLTVAYSTGNLPFLWAASFVSFVLFVINRPTVSTTV